MKFAVIGTGKTGSCILDLLPASDVEAVFDSKNPPTLDVLKRADASIIFIPGDAMLDLIPLLLEAKRPIVCGSTGIGWPKNLSAHLHSIGIPWICANNFSLGMNAMFYLAPLFKEIVSTLPGFQLKINEVHHVHKKDRPSGTALKLQSLLELKTEIFSEREGDVVGTHALEAKTSFESLSFSHEALDRSVFAKGAIWAAQELIWEPSLKGLLWFEDLMREKFNEKRSICLDSSGNTFSRWIS